MSAAPRPTTLIRITAILALGLLAACSHYRLGQPGELPFTTLYVPPVKNQSYAPQVQAMLTQQLIASLQEQQAIRIVSQPGAADATLEVTITDYRRDVASTQQGDTFLAQSFSLIMDASVTLKNNRTGQIYMNGRPLQASQQAFITGGFQPSEYEAMVVLTQKLADQITNNVTSVW